MNTAHLIDIGVNLCHESLRKDLTGVLERARAAGVTHMILTGTNAPQSETALALARQTGFHSTAGFHPHHASEFDASGLALLRELASAREVVAIGECGLDFNRDFSPRPAQERAFEQQLELAAELRLPVFLHQRDAHARFVAILRAYRDHLVDAVAHCFTGDRGELRAYRDLDLHVGITGWVCDERRGQALREAVNDVPDERLMLETDAPFLMPRTIRPRPKRNVNEPAYLPWVLQEVARLRGQEPDTVARMSTRNARRFFRLPDADTALQARP
ncbi:TatD family hydrolase [Alkalilimnicola sp. S0819]|uniref:TatD family hydrolase n=1 Tax=Alkalilimnicola sp. S0819 TaxID=2613922 RepID=UPI001261B39F|nr:TatD family hydrolase [Alkalilimnicola sp. S0819]KAB7619500.1 hydrolase TatD [Alkalilimnicola sp. S0819]MPQ17678.1 hydrolase TatD [Alkalilimnicola sp. S0819]